MCKQGGQQHCLLLVEQSSYLQALHMKTMAMHQDKAGSDNSGQWQQQTVATSDSGNSRQWQQQAVTTAGSDNSRARRGCKIILLEPECRVRLCSSARSSQEC